MKPHRLHDPTCAGLRAAALAILSVLATTAPLLAQGSVSGRVLDAGTLEPVVGAQVSVSGTEVRTLTDDTGTFRLEDLSGEQVTLRIEHIGYRPVTRTVAVGAAAIEIELSTRAIALDEIVVTGTAGAREARAIGNAVGRVNAEEIAQIAPPSDVQDLIGSRVSGVRMRDVSGAVGTGGTPVIRGVGSLSLSAAPLIYVDGVRVDNETDGGAAFGGATGGQGRSRINGLNPGDIESIEIIKGPAAATLYGTEASAGVIQIITKRGRTQAPVIQLQMTQGGSFLPNASEVYPTVWARNASGELISLNLIERDIAQGFGSPFGTGHNQGYSVSVAGGAENIRYYVSGAFERNEGIVPYNWQNGLNARTNFTFTPHPTLEANLSIGLRTAKLQTASPAQPITTHLIWGTPLLEETRTRGYIARTPEEFEEEVEGVEDIDRTTMSLNLHHAPLDWLEHRLTVGTDISNIRSSLLCRPDLANGQPCGVPIGLKGVTRERTSLLTVDYGITASMALRPDLALNTSVGAQFNRELLESDELEGRGLAIEQLETISATSPDSRSAEETFLESRTFGLYVQEQLAWNNRVFLTAALRGDDNSAFGRDFDFVTYPKLSASWVLSEEPFFDVDFLQPLRLRAAWGKAGQQPDAFAAIRTYAPVAGPGGTPALTPENVGNPNLEPEVGEELELGFDAGLFDDRLALSFTFYDQTTRNAIVAQPALPSRGFPGVQFVNLGRVGNTGFELTAGTEILRRDEFGVRLDLAVSRHTNEIEDLGRTGPIFYSAIGALTGQRHVEGFPLAGIFLPRIVNAEFDPQGNLINVLCEGGEPFTGGGAPVPCDEAPPVFIGQPTPEWVGGVSTTITLFENVEVYALAEWESGSTRLSGDIAGAHLLFRNTRCINTSCDPFLLAAERLFQQGQPFTLAGIMDGGWAKLRNVSATYRFPASLAGRLGADRASLTLSGLNLLDIWVAQEEAFGHRLPDPEVARDDPLNAFIQENWPQPMTLQAMLRLSF